MGKIISNVCRALGDVELWDIDDALKRILQAKDIKDWDLRISRLIQEKSQLELWLVEQEVDFKREEAKTKGVHRLLGLLEEHVCNTGDVVTKARLYDEAIAKIGSIISLKLIHICVD